MPYNAVNMRVIRDLFSVLKTQIKGNETIERK